MKYPPQYHAVLDFLAGSFFSDLPEQEKPPRAHYVTALLNDLQKLTATASNDPDWKLWMRVQQTKAVLLAQERKFQRVKRMSGSQIPFLTCIALHQHKGGHNLILPWNAVKQVSSLKIDRNLSVSDLARAGLPDNLWIEWTGQPDHEDPPWISRTTGLLLSRVLLFDAPADYLSALSKQVRPQENNDFTLMRELIQHVSQGVPASAYQLAIVQQDSIGYRFVMSYFGLEQHEPLVDMLALHKEVSDRDNGKFKQAEQAWANIAVRILLLAAQRQYFTTGLQQVCLESVTLGIEGGTGLFFGQKNAQGKHIAIRPAHHTVTQPFRVEHA